MTPYRSIDDAIEEFKQVYFDKTGNEWVDRRSFRKRPNKFYPLELDFGNTDTNLKRITYDDSVSLVSKLEKPVHDLIRLIFDVEKMKNAMIEFEIDLAKMPLGKLSEKQVKTAFGVLSELTTVSF
jgi:hypothetical protein